MIGSIPLNDPQENGLALIQRELRVVQLLFEISQALNKSWELEEAVQPVLKKVAEYVSMRGGSITVLNRGTGEIEIEQVYGLSSEERSKHRYRSDEGITCQVVEAGIPAIVEKGSQEPHFFDRKHALTEAVSWRIKKDIAFICAPIHGRNGTIGAVTADRLFPDEVSIDEDVLLLTTISSLLAQAIEVRWGVRERERVLREEKERLQGEILNHLKSSDIIGNSHAIRKVCQLIHQVSLNRASVLITGERGVGKELVAQTIHVNSPRADKPFIKVNLAALPESAIERELFGHQHGAGASPRRKGCLEMANGGTLFLDEVDHLPMAVQAQLLRVLQEGDFERLGSTETIKVDVRVISATNRNLEDLVQKSQFRLDLFYRLNLFPIFVPPLRERKTDILLLADHFLERTAKKHGKTIHRISMPAINLLMNYHWPGNVRELESCMERAALLSTDGIIHAHHLPPPLQTGYGADAPQNNLQNSLAALEREMIVDALQSAHGNSARAARFLGISKWLMRRRVKKHAIDSKSFRQINNAGKNRH
jgi:Nif-specific regulatory protein